MLPEIRLATSKSDRRAIFHFRYQVYIEELGCSQSSANHQTRMIEEPLDVDARLVAAWCDGQIVGTVRFNHGSDTNVMDYARMFQLHRFVPFFPNRVTLTSKLMTARGFRNGILSLRLFAAAFERGIGDGICFDFMHCDSRRLPFFQRMGYRQYIPDVVHRDFGSVHPMICVLHDREFFQHLGSPLAAFCPVNADDFGSVDFFNRQFVRSNLEKSRLMSR